MSQNGEDRRIVPVNLPYPTDATICNTDIPITQDAIIIVDKNYSQFSSAFLYIAMIERCNKIALTAIILKQ